MFNLDETVVESALARLTSMYSDKPNIVALVQALATRGQIVENALFSLAQGQLFGNAVGAQLDDIGNLVGADRNGLSDAQYRLLIQGTIAENCGNGTLASLLTIASALWETGDIVIRTPSAAEAVKASAWVSLEIGGSQLPANLDSLAVSIFRKALAAGVDLISVTKTTALGSTAFAFAGSTPGAGFGTLLDNTLGGGFASLAFTDANA